MAKTDLVIQAQQRGITLSEDDEGAWHGSYIHDGQEYTLDGETLEGISDDMNALADILTQDDTYSVDYNEDADRYLVTADGFNEPFTAQVLAEAFAAAQDAVNAKLQAEEDARKARAAAEEAAAKAAAAPKPAKAPKNGNGATAAPAAASSSAVELPAAVADAVVGLLAAITEVILKGANPPVEIPAAPVEAPPPPKATRKRGLGKA